MGNSQNEELARRGIDVFNTGDTSVVSEITADDAVGHDPAQGEDTHGSEAFAQIVEMYRGMFPDLHMKVDDQFSDGDMVCTRWSSEGTHEESGKHVAVTGITIDKVQDGKIVESWTQWDNAGMMQQLGVGETAGAAAG